MSATSSVAGPQELLLQLLDPASRATPYAVYEQFRDRGPMPWRNLYGAVQETEEVVFMGDLSFHRILRDLNPLVLLTDQKVALTDAGRQMVDRS